MPKQVPAAAVPIVSSLICYCSIATVACIRYIAFPLPTLFGVSCRWYVLFEFGIPFKIVSLAVLQLRIAPVSTNGHRKSMWLISSLWICLGDGPVPPDVWRHTDTSSMILWTIFMVPHFARIWCYIGQHTELVSSCERLKLPKLGTKNGPKKKHWLGKTLTAYDTGKDQENYGHTVGICTATGA